MPHVNFGTSGEPGFELKESPDLLAVRTRSRRSVRGSGPVPRPAAEIDPRGGRYDSSGHSDAYGYGRLNAATAVELAKQSVGRLVIVRKLLNDPIPDLGRVEGTIDIADTTPVEKLAVSIRLKHTYIGDLVISIHPPEKSGLSKVVLHNRAGGRRDDLDRIYDSSNTPGLSAYAGKKCNGTWTVRVEDRAAEDSGALVQIELQLSLPPQPPVRHVTSPPIGGRLAKIAKDGRPKPLRKTMARRKT